MRFGQKLVQFAAQALAARICLCTNANDAPTGAPVIAGARTETRSPYVHIEDG